MDREIGYRKWIVHQSPAAVFLLVHGIGAYIGRWEAMADFFLKKRISSYAIDCPKPENCRGGIRGLRDIIVKDNPGKKIFLVGESLGGIIALLLAAAQPDLFDGIVCFSPAFKNKLKLPASDYLKILMSLIYNPKREFKMPFNSAMCTRDIEYSKKMDIDRREYRSATAGSLFETLFSQARAGLSVKKLKTPVLFLVAGDDKIVDPEASMEIFKRLTVRDKTLITYPGMYHSLSVELGKEKVFEDLSAWVEKRI